MNSPTILITGGCGFIGVNLVNYLLRRGVRYIRILDNLSTGTKENLQDALGENGEILGKGKNDGTSYALKENSKEGIRNNVVVDLVIGDIRSYETCLKATQNIDVVVHLAAHTGVIPSIEDPFYDWEVNVKGTLNLLYTSVRNKIDKFIFTSSNAPLGDQGPQVTEETTPRPLSPYGASKLACEGYCSAFHGSYGLKAISLRLSNVYGPYSLHKSSVVAKFMKDGLLKGKLTIHGDGHQTRDLVHVDDICQAVCLILNKSHVPPSPSRNIWGIPLHLGTGEETSILELAKIVQGFLAQETKISFVSERTGEMKRSYSDITRAKKALGFSPQILLQEGAQAVYHWFKSKDLDELRGREVLSRSNV